ncbi:MAG TPA: crosslink repair DNA glycosylase YcaQ family protein [Phycisphaerales bacterium]|nr:crosslink repair DNA glycosylase YcaQ family protein [Phycisphaerales bacterium]HMP36210.1 crosslink repair DNA glycosylase YcaQ family protein [Phycisphaerales bacterium]
MPARAAQRISTTQAARLLLLAQGLLDSPVGAAPANRVAACVERLGFVQIDSINVVERAHHLTLHTRLDEYRPASLHALLEDERMLFEHWTHDASAIPLAFYPFWHDRFARSAVKIRRNAWWRERMGARPQRILDRVLERVRAEGPLQARDFDGPKRRGGAAAPRDEPAGWWNWKPEKAALEYLWRTGKLAVARRERFEKVYDLVERVHGEHHARPQPTRAELIEWACISALERLGTATPRELARFWHAIELPEAKRWCDAAVRDGRVSPVRIAGAGSPARGRGASRDSSALAGPFTEGVALVDWRTRLDAAPAAPPRVRILSPFDPVIRDRARLARLFDFDYRFEAFVPAAKRVYGYYTLPLLEGERFVGRAHIRADRPARRLVVDGLWWEATPRLARARRSALDDSLEESLHRLARIVAAEGEPYSVVMAVGERPAIVLAATRGAQQSAEARAASAKRAADGGLRRPRIEAGRAGSRRPRDHSSKRASETRFTPPAA